MDKVPTDDMIFLTVQAREQQVDCNKEIHTPTTQDQQMKNNLIER